MTAKFVQEGVYLDFTPATDLPAGSVVVVGGQPGITTRDYATGEVAAARVVGVFDVPKAAATAFAEGATVFFNTATGLAVTAAGAGIVKLGRAARAATGGASGDTIVRTRLDPSAA